MHFHAYFTYQWGSIHKGNNLLLWEQILPSKHTSLFERLYLSEEGNSKSLKLFPVVKINKKHGDKPYT